MVFKRLTTVVLALIFLLLGTPRSTEVWGQVAVPQVWLDRDVLALIHAQDPAALFAAVDVLIAEAREDFGIDVHAETDDGDLEFSDGQRDANLDALQSGDSVENFAADFQTLRDAWQDTVSGPAVFAISAKKLEKQAIINFAFGVTDAAAIIESLSSGIEKTASGVEIFKFDDHAMFFFIHEGALYGSNNLTESKRVWKRITRPEMDPQSLKQDRLFQRFENFMPESASTIARIYIDFRKFPAAYNRLEKERIEASDLDEIALLHWTHRDEKANNQARKTTWAWDGLIAAGLEIRIDEEQRLSWTQCRLESIPASNKRQDFIESLRPIDGELLELGFSSGLKWLMLVNENPEFSARDVYFPEFFVGSNNITCSDTKHSFGVQFICDSDAGRIAGRYGLTDETDVMDEPVVSKENFFYPPFEKEVNPIEFATSQYAFQLFDENSSGLGDPTVSARARNFVDKLELTDDPFPSLGSDFFKNKIARYLNSGSDFELIGAIATKAEIPYKLVPGIGDQHIAFILSLLPTAFVKSNTQNAEQQRDERSPTSFICDRALTALSLINIGAIKRDDLCLQLFHLRPRKKLSGALLTHGFLRPSPRE